MHGIDSNHMASELVSHNQGHKSLTGYAASDLVVVVLHFVSQW